MFNLKKTPTVTLAVVGLLTLVDTHEITGATASREAEIANAIDGAADLIRVAVEHRTGSGPLVQKANEIEQAYFGELNEEDSNFATCQCIGQLIKMQC